MLQYKMRQFLNLQISMMVISFVLAYELWCPEAGNWLLRAKLLCEKQNIYTCLYDDNNERYVEMCSRERTFPEGFKAVVRDYIDIDKCSRQRFQPLYFSTYGQSRCIFEKSRCENDGQIIFDNRTTSADRSCTCDERLGYTFATYLSKDSCVPFYEDCSCFKSTNISVTTITENVSSTRSANVETNTESCLLEDGIITDTRKLYNRDYCIATVAIPILIILLLIIFWAMIFLVFGIGMTGYKFEIFERLLIESKTETDKDQTETELREITQNSCMVNNREGQCFDETTYSRHTGSTQQTNQDCCMAQTVVNTSSNVDCIKTTQIMEYGLESTHVKTTENTQNVFNRLKDKHKFGIHSNKLRHVVPVNIRENINSKLKKWECADNVFAPTCASKELEKIIKTEKVVIVTGGPGTGKSFTVRHISLIMKHIGYDVIPVSSTSDIVKYFDKRTLQVFLLDDFCGRHNISNYALEEWEQNEFNISDVFSCPQTKCIFACRLQIYQDPLFKNLNLRDFKVMDLSGNYRLQLQDKMLIAKNHLDHTVIETLSEKTIIECMCFPLLCFLYNKHSKESFKFFKTPIQFYEGELNELKKKSDKLKYACIALCVMFNNDISLDVFKTATNLKKSSILMNVFEELEVNITTPKKTLRASMDSLVGTYLKKSESGYKAIHDYLFDIFCTHLSAAMMECVINHADSKLISERALLQFIDENNDFVISIPTELEYMFFNRIKRDITELKIVDVFKSYQMKYQQYRLKFIEILRGTTLCLDVFDESGISPLSTSSEQGYADILEMLCSHGGKVNTWIDQSPLHLASSRGHRQCVDILLRYGADVNKCTPSGFSSLYLAARDGYRDIVEILCDNGADVNLCTENGVSPLYIACSNGHTDCIDVMLKMGADVNKCDNIGRTPLYRASNGGHFDIVHVLCQKGGDVNKCTENDISPLFIAAQKGHTKIIEILLSKGGNVNKCTVYDESPLYAASFYGHQTCVKILLDKGADVNILNKYQASPLFVAALNGYSDIVNILLVNGALIDQCTIHGESPLYAASSYGKTLCVEMLLYKGAKVNHCSNDGASPLYAAAKEGNIDIIMTLYKNGANVNQVTKTGMSPVNIADLRGRKECVQFLLSVETKLV